MYVCMYFRRPIDDTFDVSRGCRWQLNGITEEISGQTLRKYSHSSRYDAD